MLKNGAPMLREAALTGGLGPLNAEIIAETLISGGVGSEVAIAMGKDVAFNVVGGIAGSVASKPAIKRVRQR